MALKKPRFNNMKLSYVRQSEVYEAVMLDLYLIGALRKDTVEQLTGRQIPDNLIVPVAVEDSSGSRQD